MKKMKRRSVGVIILVGILLIGTAFYIFKFLKDGGDWVSFPSNRSIYTDGVLASGTVYDRNGAVLSGVTDGGQRYYNDSELIRESTLHAVGDLSGNIGTSALASFADKLVGYDILNGTYSLSGKGNNLYLSIDSELNAVAYNALAGRKGTVAVYNYKTGEVLCMVSSPTFDPANPPDLSNDDGTYEGVYLNRFLSTTYVPGSTFKLVTAAAALETFPDAYERQYECNGSVDIGGDIITCTGNHGSITLEDALAYSCNCYFSQLAVDLGGEKLAEYAKKMGLTESFDVNGMPVAKGSFDIAPDGSADLGWSGIGQYNDMVNPCAMLRLMGAIANGGVPVIPRLISKSTTSGGFPTGIYVANKGDRLLDETTADALKAMMRYNVQTSYGDDNYPGLNLCAKSGTAEVGGDMSPHAWFVGFIDNEETPLAFVVVVENGGWGSQTAGTVANTVLQEAVKTFE